MARAKCIFEEKLPMVQLYAHVVFYVDNQKKPFHAELADDTAHFVRTVCAYKGTSCVDVCVMPDHIHMLLKYNEHTNLERVFDTLRCWIVDYAVRRTSEEIFQWKKSYWLVSKSPTCIEAMKKYFRRQRDYHATIAVVQEWKDMLDLEEIGEDVFLDEV